MGSLWYLWHTICVLSQGLTLSTAGLVNFQQCSENFISLCFEIFMTTAHSTFHHLSRSININLSNTFLCVVQILRGGLSEWGGLRRGGGAQSGQRHGGKKILKWLVDLTSSLPWSCICRVWVSGDQYQCSVHWVSSRAGAWSERGKIERGLTNERRSYKELDQSQPSIIGLASGLSHWTRLSLGPEQAGE